MILDNTGTSASLSEKYKHTQQYMVYKEMGSKGG
jgi:hypothetical protein